MCCVSGCVVTKRKLREKRNREYFFGAMAEMARGDMCHEHGMVNRGMAGPRTGDGRTEQQKQAKDQGTQRKTHAQQETSHKSYVKSWHLREDLAPGQVLT